MFADHHQLVAVAVPPVEEAGELRVSAFSLHCSHLPLQGVSWHGCSSWALVMDTSLEGGGGHSCPGSELCSHIPLGRRLAPLCRRLACLSESINPKSLKLKKVQGFNIWGKKHPLSVKCFPLTAE